jgi:hypothetical protein
MRFHDTSIAGGEGSVQNLCERHIDRIAGGERVPQFPYARKERLVGVSDQRQVPQVPDGLGAAACIDSLGCGDSSQHLSHLDVDQVGGAEDLFRPEQPVHAPRADRGIHKHLEDDGRVQYGQRPSLSARRISVGEEADGTGDLSASRLRISAVEGRSATFLISAIR